MATSSGPTLSLDIIHHIAVQLAEEKVEELAFYRKKTPWYRSCDTLLRRLTYLSHATKDLLTPLLYRHIILADGLDVTNYWITFAQQPSLRQHVQYLACYARLSGSSWRKGWLPKCRAAWVKRCPTDKTSFMSMLASDCGLHSVAWLASMLERRKKVFMFNADFSHDGIIELMFASTLFMLPNIQTFNWMDSNSNPKAYVLKGVLAAALAGVPLMPQLRELNVEKETVDYVVGDNQPQFFVYKTHLWEDLQTLHLHAMDLDKEFIQFLVANAFKENRPVKKLYVSCIKDAETRRYGVGAFTSDYVSPGELLLDPDNPEKDKAKFKAFPNLDYLNVSFSYSQRRAIEGSRTLRAFLHAVGAPETLILTGHPLPSQALDTGRRPPRASKHIRVREMIPSAPSKTRSRDQLVGQINTFWNMKQAVAPNLSAIDWDNYRFRRHDLEGEDKAVWVLEGEDEWEDDSSDDDMLEARINEEMMLEDVLQLMDDDSDAVYYYGSDNMDMLDEDDMMGW
ncbi:hypothetical protein NM208_g9135 [Fusarium decemcellulare]|uniref:Uncharacterized protein n=1 Tax=Fusarium decemcellulare TaxID=57161 RepID=A0ACC1S2T1_9HYPO|nr:hypothetical protein NM208_g9135 [Fusarium decemcellulare]